MFILYPGLAWTLGQEKSRKAIILEHVHDLGSRAFGHLKVCRERLSFLGQVCCWVILKKWLHINFITM